MSVAYKNQIATGAFWVFVVFQFTIPYRPHFVPLSAATMILVICTLLTFALHAPRISLQHLSPILPFFLALCANVIFLDEINFKIISGLFSTCVFFYILFYFDNSILSVSRFKFLLFNLFKILLILNFLISLFQIIFGQDYFVAYYIALSGSDYRIPTGLYDVHTTYSIIIGFMFIFCLGYLSRQSKLDFLMIVILVVAPAFFMLSGSRAAIVAMFICTFLWTILSSWRSATGRTALFLIVIGTISAIFYLSHQSTQFPAAEIFQYRIFFPMLSAFEEITGIDIETNGKIPALDFAITLLNEMPKLYPSGAPQVAVDPGGTPQVAVDPDGYFTTDGVKAIVSDGSSLERGNIYQAYISYYSEFRVSSLLGVSSRFTDTAYNLTTTPHNSFLDMLNVGGIILLCGFVAVLIKFLQQRFWGSIFFLPTLFVLLYGMFWDIYFARWIWIGFAFLFIDRKSTLAAQSVRR